MFKKIFRFKLFCLLILSSSLFLVLSCRNIKTNKIDLGDTGVSPDYLNQAIRIEPKIYLTPKWYYFVEEANRYPTIVSNISKQAYKQFKDAAKELGYVKDKFNPSNFNRDYLVLGKLPYQKTYTNNYVKYVPEVVNEGGSNEHIRLYLSDYQSLPTQDASKEHVYTLLVVKNYDTRTNPWGIYLAYDFKDLEDSSESFIIKNDIEMGITQADFVGSRYIPDFDKYGWKGIRNFSGTLDGNFQVIRNLTIYRSEEENLGLFKELKGTVRNIVIQDASIAAKTQAGILAGTLAATAVVDGGVFQGTIKSRGSTGGVAGVSSAPIDQVYANVNILQQPRKDDIPSNNVGGFVGSNLGSISNSWNLGYVEGYGCVGSMVGNNQGRISKSYTLLNARNLKKLVDEPRLKFNEEEMAYKPVDPDCLSASSNSIDRNTVFAPYYKIYKILFGEKYWCFIAEDYTTTSYGYRLILKDSGDNPNEGDPGFVPPTPTTHYHRRMLWTDTPRVTPNGCFWFAQSKSPEDPVFRKESVSWEPYIPPRTRLPDLPSDATAYMGPGEAAIPIERPLVYKDPKVSIIYRDFSTYEEANSNATPLGELEVNPYYPYMVGGIFFQNRGLDVGLREFNIESIWDFTTGEWVTLRRFRKFQPKCPLPFRQLATSNYQPVCKFE